MSAQSLALDLAAQSAEVREAVLAGMTDEEIRALQYRWEFWARPTQLAPPGGWVTWLILSGRGWGKTRTGAEWVRANVDLYQRWALIGPTAGDVRDTMVEGESGLLSIFPPDQRPTYYPSKRKVEFTNGAEAHLYSAKEPDRLRGPQHEAAWSDEVAAWVYPEAWDMLQLGLRLGVRPRQVATTTPKPVKVVRELVKSETTVVTKGSTYDNIVNLAPTFAATIINRYEGTTLGRQEVYGELLNELPGALWRWAMIDDNRVKVAPQMQRVVVAIDPAVTATDDSDETGIAVCGKGINGDFYVIESHGLRVGPNAWARFALDAYSRHSADRLIAERNNGGDMVAATLAQVDRNVPVKTIHASKGKAIRAEPIAALYEQNRVHHVGVFEGLEDQMVLFPVASDLDDQVDAMVYALTELAIGDPFSSVPAPAQLHKESAWTGR